MPQSMNEASGQPDDRGSHLSLPTGEPQVLKEANGEASQHASSTDAETFCSTRDQEPETQCVASTLEISRGNAESAGAQIAVPSASSPLLGGNKLHSEQSGDATLRVAMEELPRGEQGSQPSPVPRARTANSCPVAPGLSEAKADWTASIAAIIASRRPVHDPSPYNQLADDSWNDISMSRDSRIDESEFEKSL